MAKKKEIVSMPKVGAWAFLAGLVLAIVMNLPGVPVDQGIMYAILGILGLVVGFINVSDKETVEFLVASIALIASSNALLGVINALPSLVIGPFDFRAIIGGTLAAFVVFIGPAAGVVSIKALFEAAKSHE